jgi:hypothetical protein
MGSGRGPKPPGYDMQSVVDADQNSRSPHKVKKTPIKCKTITVTPLGAISRLEHALDGFEEERYRYRQRLEDYQRRLASYQSRQGGSFAFTDELAEKRRLLHEVEEALAGSVGEDAIAA